VSERNPVLTVSAKPGTGNADFDWDTFDSAAYFEHNYGALRRDDEKIIELVTRHFERNVPPDWSGPAIDVGSGANLYPAMMMLPYASRVTLYERAYTNRVWLEKELIEPRPSWERFWSAIAEDRPEYQRINKPFDVLHRHAAVEKGNIFELKPGRYGIGTMFFVAESITTRESEFTRATRSFVNSLRPGAPFAAAFMQNSSGYIVGSQRFPACSINEDDVRKALAPVARKVEIEPIESHGLRDGYSGMLVAIGKR
jgi:hypothetical protein